MPPQMGLLLDGRRLPLDSCLPLDSRPPLDSRLLDGRRGRVRIAEVFDRGD